MYSLSPKFENFIVTCFDLYIKLKYVHVKLIKIDSYTI